MFYIKFGLKNRESSVPRAADGIRYVGVPEQFAGLKCYYRIYEDGRPLNDMSFGDEILARKRLKTLVDELNAASMGWYRVENRSRPYLPIRTVLSVRKIYGDGSTVNVTYVIRKIVMHGH